MLCICRLCEEIEPLAKRNVQSVKRILQTRLEHPEICNFHFDKKRFAKSVMFQAAWLIVAYRFELELSTGQEYTEA